MKIFFGWWIVAGSVLARSLSGGLNAYGVSAFFLPLAEEFGTGRAALSGAISLSRLEAGLIGPVEGYLVDRFGPRKLMFAGIFLMGLGFILMSQINSLALFYVVYIVGITLGSSIGIGFPTQVAVANWFRRKRGIAMGIAGSGVGLGGVIVPFLAWAIANFGWRSAAIVVGLIIWAFGFPIATLMRHRPEAYGYLPDGDVAPRQTSPTAEAHSNHAEIRSANTVADEEESFTVMEAMRTKAFWLISIGFSLRLMVTSAVVIHQIPFLIGMGIAPEVAGAILGSLGVVSIAGRFGFAFLADRMEPRYLTALCCALLAAGMFILMNSTTTWHLILYIAVYAPGYGGLTSLMPIMKANYFGPKSFGQVLGISGLVQMVGTVSGPFLAGLVYDLTGSYQIAFFTFAIAGLLAMIIFLVSRRPTKRSTPAVGTPMLSQTPS